MKIYIYNDASGMQLIYLWVQIIFTREVDRALEILTNCLKTFKKKILSR